MSEEINARPAGDQQIIEYLEDNYVDVSLAYVDIPFWGLVGLMVKWSLAAIPALIILAAVGLAISVVGVGLLSAISGV